MSKPIVTGLLRDTLHFNGVVVTDALSAAALGNIPPAQRAVQAIEAGVDQLLMPSNLGDSINAVLAAVHDGTISEARIDQSVTRLLKLKQKLGLFANSQVDAAAAASRVGTPAQDESRLAPNDSITLVRNQDHALPFASGTGKHVLVTGWGAGTTQTLTDPPQHGVTTSGSTPARPHAATRAAAVAAANASDQVVVLTDNAWGDTGQQHCPGVARYRQARRRGVSRRSVRLGLLPDRAHVRRGVRLPARDLDRHRRRHLWPQPRGHLPVTINSTGTPPTVVAPYGSGLHY